MSRPAQRMAFGAALALAVACGGQAFTTTTDDAGPGDGTIDAALGDDSGHGSIDAPGDVSASDAASEGAGDTAGDGPRDAAKDAAPAPDSSVDATSDVVTTPDGPSSGGDGESDASPPEDVFVPDVLEEPPPHCGGAFACAPGVPSGWSGPFELYIGSGAAPSCSANFTGPAYNGNNNLIAKAATCGCTCGSATGIACSAPSISFYGQSVVSGGTCASSNYCSAVALSPGACTHVPAQCTGLLTASQDMSAGASVPALTNASCPPLPSETIPPVAWNTVARACMSSLAPAQVDCAAGSICAPLPASPFLTQICISQQGNIPCPAGYTVAEEFYGGVNDGRGCSTCSCGAVTGASCSASVSVSSSTNGTCSGSTISYVTPYTCDAVNSSGDFRVTTASTGGGCTPSTVMATGTASPATPTTFCCLP